MKQTAIDYLVEQFTLNSGVIYVGTINKIKEIKKAKEMEKEQIIDAYLKDRKRRDFLNALKLMDKAEEYYNKTYKNK